MSNSSIIEELEARISGADLNSDQTRVGFVSEVKDGVAKVIGITDVQAGEMLKITSGSGKIIDAVALNLNTDSVWVIILGASELVAEGDRVQLAGKILSVPVGKAMLGRVVDALGNPIDGKGPIKTDQENPIERPAPGVLDRKSVHQPLQTGIVAIDSMIPIGRGQRELIIGDRQTGKTAIAVDTMINQKDSDIVNIYVAIGQKESKIARLVSDLTTKGVMDKTVIVVAGASDPAAMSYIAPYSGAAIGEYFMDNSGHALVIYDDLSKHAVAYREISLLLRRPPGREAYPGDIFYLHSRLLERAAKLSDDLGAGSLTALPIIETQAGDVSAFIPTNVISITDGQIYLETDLFHQGIRPALNVGLSVSRVGSSAQTKAIKNVAGQLRLDLAQYRDLAAFAQLASDLDAQTKAKLDRGQRIVEMLKQPQYQPYNLSHQVVLIWVATNGFLDDVALDQVGDFNHRLIDYLDQKYLELIDQIESSDMKGEEVDLLRTAVERFKREEMGGN